MKKGKKKLACGLGSSLDASCDLICQQSHLGSSSPVLLGPLILQEVAASQKTTLRPGDKIFCRSTLVRQMPMRIENLSSAERDELGSWQNMPRPPIIRSGVQWIWDLDFSAVWEAMPRFETWIPIFHVKIGNSSSPSDCWRAGAFQSASGWNLGMSSAGNFSSHIIPHGYKPWNRTQQFGSLDLKVLVNSPRTVARTLPIPNVQPWNLN